MGDFATTNVSLSNFTPVDDYTFEVDATPDGDGAVSIQLPAGVATDPSGNDNLASNTIAYTYDGTAPTPSVSTTSTNPTDDNPIPVVIAFGEVVGGAGAAAFQEN